MNNASDGLNLKSSLGVEDTCETNALHEYVRLR